ncbi:TPR-like protein [Piromyces finnis]|uniref:TPR-like protein n=1 Tax=Piromyces finnis TaxID=1754191 RepID=A0A1Y1VC53_9FUNG|nr:TPR-like protein [Piromyces finnis]|eukprot:ORX51042.1 TPR-like protein [Piromyces finnis]
MENQNKKKGWKKTKEKYMFDDEIINYFQNKHRSMIEFNNKENLNENFTVTLVGNTHHVNEGLPFELRLGKKFSAFAFEKCIHTMEKGENSLFLCAPHSMMAYNTMESILHHVDYKKSLLKQHNVGDKNGINFSKKLIDYKNYLNKKYQDLCRDDLVFIIEIELVDIQLPESYQKCVWEMDDTEKYFHAVNLKNEGNILFKANEFNKASVKFQEALSIYQVMIHSGSLLNEKFQKLSVHKDSFDEPKKDNKSSLYTLESLTALSNICLLNYSACQLKLKNYHYVIESCTEVLRNDPENIKAYFRRGKAYSNLNSHLDLAKKDFYKLKDIYHKFLEEEDRQLMSVLPAAPANKINYKNEIKNLNEEIKLLEKKIKQQSIQDKTFFSKIFS